MTTSPPIQDDEQDEEFKLKQIIKEQNLIPQINSHNHDDVASEQQQQQFNQLSKDKKMNRLNKLIEKSQIYSQIIADNILQTSLERKEEQNNVAPPAPVPAKSDSKNESDTQPIKKRRKTKPKSKSTANGKQDIVSMLSTNISDSTKSTREAIEKSQNSSKITNNKQPKLITGGQLKDYQMDGLEWLITLFQNGLNGILADEMGLGKTLQCISFLSHLIENGINGPFLVVVPVSTLSNWYNEIRKFAPKIKVTKYIGTKQERNDIDLLQQQETTNIILTSYEISIRDFNKLVKINWKYLIVDEGHRLKNSQCLLIKILKKLNVSNRLLLTGTPLQNNLNELWSLLNFILPDIFHDLELFQQWFNFDELTELAGELEETLIKNLHTILKPFMLRRLKRDVIKNLPPKKEYLLHIPMTKLQKKIYYDAVNDKLFDSLVETNLKAFIKFNHEELFNGFDVDEYLKTRRQRDSFMETGGLSKLRGSRSDRNSLKRSYKEADSDEEFEIMDAEDDSLTGRGNTTPSYDEALVKIRHIKSKTKIQSILIDAIYQDILKEAKHLKLQNLKMIQLRNICNSPFIYYNYPILDQAEVIRNSAKFQVLNQLLPPLLSSGHKVLIFAQFTKVLDLLEDWLEESPLSHGKICRLDGSTNHQIRDEQISQFNNNPKFKVFLSSTRAGGLGINLVAADTVILMDNDWNPQMDLQVIDRVHRIGQINPVKIFRFVIKDSIEEVLISRSGSKRFLERLVIQMGQFKFSNFNKKLTAATTSNEQGAIKNDWSINDMMELKEDEKILLSDQEIDELLDRSVECYNSIDDSKFDKVKIFETVNNMDK
ncbi:SNF2 N-terminal domain family protein [Candida albicans]|uniref:SNF2 N-terminal domain family protein n=1 Tax=Candida albicans TaxID=5476 RepID=A0A8H6C427_CANAX|nr:SNF2 N-terminal domain family protein [Candida albicans]